MTRFISDETLVKISQKEKKSIWIFPSFDGCRFLKVEISSSLFQCNPFFNNCRP